MTHSLAARLGTLGMRPRVTALLAAASVLAPLGVFFGLRHWAPSLTTRSMWMLAALAAIVVALAQQSIP